MVLNLVHKSISAANGPSLTPIEINNRCDDWYELLYGVVPEKMLYQAFRRAVHDHKGGFPVSVSEVIQGYNTIFANPGENMPKADAIASLPAAPPRYDCDRCFGSGHENIFDIDGTVVGVKPANSCDHRPFTAGEARLFKPSDVTQSGGANNV